MKKYSFFLSAMILALGGFFAKAIGAIYKIPLTNILGSSGMGLYYLIFPVYSLLITFCSSGLSVALSTEVAKCRKIRQRYNEQKLLRVALLFTFLLSVLFSFVLIIICKPLSELQGNINAYMGYIVISPAIILSSIIAILRGYFQGVENMVPTTVSMIVEQIIKLSLGLLLAHKLCNYGIQYAVLGAVIGVTISEVIALIFIAINFFTYKGQLYYNYRNKWYSSKRKIIVRFTIKSHKKINKSAFKIKDKYYRCNSIKVRYSTFIALKKLFKVSVASTLSSIIVPIISMLDSFMIINILTSKGFASHTSTAMYGLWGGMVQTLISLPTVLIVAISSAIIPSLSGLIAKNDTNELRNRIKFYIKFTWVISLIMFVIVYIYAEDILIFLYGDGLDTTVINELAYATKMLKISSISIVYYAMMQAFTSILQTIGKAHIPFVSMLISVVARIILLISLTGNTYINIFGPIIANIIFLSISTIIMAIVIRQHFELNYKLFNHFISPLVLSIIILIIAFISHHLLKGVINYFWSMLITAVVVLCIYIVGIYYGKVFSDKDKKYFLKKKTITKNTKKI